MCGSTHRYDENLEQWKCIKVNIKMLPKSSDTLETLTSFNGFPINAKIKTIAHLLVSYVVKFDSPHKFS